ncbi:MAG TPA: SulP family inorganic anion transporter, partial [Bacteroidales bacterium]|nr:SulP family inorganic anion transporter [Bacteroidales bacterium]
QEFGTGGLVIATFMAGFLLIGMGLVKMGNLLKFIPYPLIIGFTSGIALIIFSSQVKDVLGLEMGEVPADFISKWVAYFHHLQGINPWALAIALFTMALTAWFHKITPRVPGSIVAILLSTLAVVYFDLPVETIETRFGEISGTFSLPVIPAMSWETFKSLLQPAFAIALLGSIESLLSAVVADGMTGSRHRSNMELIAQGGANVFSAMFGGIPATGAIARTATNIRNGGRTPVAGLVHAAVLLLIMLFLAPYARLIPFAALAGILVVISYRMGEWGQFYRMLRSTRLDVIILLNTFLLTVIFDLVIAIEVGIVLSSFLFMKRMAEVTQVRTLGQESDGDGQLFEEELKDIPKGVVIYEVNGPLFFGAARQFQDTLLNIHEHPHILILRMRNVQYVDATGVYRLGEMLDHFRRRNTQVILSGVNAEVRSTLERAGLYAFIPHANVLPNIAESLARARTLLR